MSSSVLKEGEPTRPAAAEASSLDLASLSIASPAASPAVSTRVTAAATAAARAAPAKQQSKPKAASSAVALPKGPPPAGGWRRDRALALPPCLLEWTRAAAFALESAVEDLLWPTTRTLVSDETAVEQIEVTFPNDALRGALQAEAARAGGGRPSFAPPRRGVPRHRHTRRRRRPNLEELAARRGGTRGGDAQGGHARAV